MSLSAAQVISVAGILDITIGQVNLQIANLGAAFSSDIEAAVIAYITEWKSGIGVKSTKIHPMEKNYGVETNPDADRARIRKAVAGLFERPDWAASSGSAQGMLERG